jgi:hypothetical protein
MKKDKTPKGLISGELTKRFTRTKKFQDTLEGVLACRAYLEAPNGALIGFAYYTKDFYLFFEMIKGNKKNIILKDMQENIYKEDKNEKR